MSTAAYRKEYYQRNREKYLSMAKERHWANRDKLLVQMKARSKKHYLKNREKILARQKEYQLNNREQVRTYQQGWYQLNKERVHKNIVAWRRNNQELTRMMYRRRQYRERGAVGNHSLQEWECLKEVYDYTCPMCYLREPDIILTEDHKIPLAKGGTNYIDNIQPLCKPCNSKKSAKTWFACYPINYKQHVNSIIC